MSKIVGVEFYNKELGESRGREYNYFDGIGNLAVGDLAVAIVRGEEKLVKVTAVDVPEEKVGERILPLLKTITKRYEPPTAKAPAEEITMEELDNV